MHNTIQTATSSLSKAKEGEELQNSTIMRTRAPPSMASGFKIRIPLGLAKVNPSLSLDIYYCHSITFKTRQTYLTSSLIAASNALDDTAQIDLIF